MAVSRLVRVIVLPLLFFLLQTRRRCHLSAWLPRDPPASPLRGDLPVLDFYKQMCKVASTGLATLSCGDSYAQSSGQGPGVGVRDVFSRGMTGVQEWPPGLDHRRPFFDEHPRQGVYLHLPIPVPQMRSSLPRYVPTSAHDLVI
jgi:hypothetical protein